MEKNELTRRYELMIIVDVKLTNEEKDAVCKEAVDIVNKAGAKVINSQVWMEKQKFTFEIKKHAEGTYYLINFESDASNLDAMEAPLKLNESILRFLITKIETN